MRVIIILISILIISACQPDIPKCAIVRDEFLRVDGSRVFATSFTHGVSDEFRDKGKDSIGGGYYSFYKNGNLKSYHYFIDMEKYIYTEQFDTTGILMYEDGNPLVHKAGELVDDSLVLKFYFFTLKKKYNKIELKISKTQTVPLSLENDTLFSNVKSARYVYHNLKFEKDIGAFIDVEYENECTGQTKAFKDSINLHYKPYKQ